MNNSISKITKVFLGVVYIFVFIHFLKDITQDILRISTALDIFGDVKEDISFLPYILQLVFYYGLGGLSFIVEAFLLITIPKILLGKQTDNLKKWVFAGIIYLLMFLTTCTFLDPRFNPIKNNPAVAQSIIELTQERPNCEFQSNLLRSQPINLLTNIAFLVSSFLTFALIKKNKIKDKGIYLLFIASILIGLGSISHHTIPNNFTLLLDGLPIYIFLFVGLSQLLYILTNNRFWAVLLTTLYVLLNFFAPIVIKLPFDPNAVTPIVNLVFLLPIILIFYKRFGSKTNVLTFSFGLYALATTFFLLDEKICYQFPIGTHFLWHIFNAISIYYLVRYIVLIKYSPEGRENRACKK